MKRKNQESGMPGSKIHTQLIPVFGPRWGILELAKITLGDNYLIADDLENIRYNWICLLYGGDVKGFASYTFRGDVATIADVAVDPEYQGYGWGSNLISIVLEALKQFPVDTVRCPAWETSSGVHLDKALRRNGFTRKDRMLRTPENARSGFSCPVCGDKCKCHMVIYETSLNNCYGNT